MTLKNRSNKFTTGVCVSSIHDNESKRLCFFELDLEHKSSISRVRDTYERHGLDYIIHRTGNGWHFLSPTVVSLEDWKTFMSDLKEVNKKCPMITLRIQPNKHPDEDSIWYLSEWWQTGTNDRLNSIFMVQMLNRLFKSDFRGDNCFTPKVVRYPLPLPKVVT